MSVNDQLARIEAKLRQLLQKMRGLEKQNKALTQENQQLKQLLEFKNELIRELQNSKTTAPITPTAEKPVEPEAKPILRDYQKSTEANVSEKGKDSLIVVPLVV
jgi:regulator of replication initiation timing